MTANEYMSQPHVMSYLNELAAQISLNGGFDGKDAMEVISLAHKQRESFLVEMLNNETTRSQMARMALASKIKIDAVAMQEKERFITRINEYAIQREVKDAQEQLLSM